MDATQWKPGGLMPNDNMEGDKVVDSMQIQMQGLAKLSLFPSFYPYLYDNDINDNDNDYNM